MALAHKFQLANEKYATDYPASIGAAHDQHGFDAVSGFGSGNQPAGGRTRAQIGNGWIPTTISAPDLYVTFTDDDFRLGLNAAQTTLGAIAQLASATLLTIQTKPE